MSAKSTTPLYGTPKVGGDALSFCTRCKMELAHVIVSMLNGRPAKVLCKTCKTQHNYRRLGDINYRASHGGAKERTPKQRIPVSAVRAAELWETKVAEKKLAPLKPYQVQGSYAAGDVVQHSKFGVGIVEDVKINGKMTVLFREGEKILIHNGGPSSQTTAGA